MTGIALTAGIAVGVIAILVWGAVSFFGGTILDGNFEDEIILVSNVHIWVSPNGTSSVAGLVVQNVGANPVNIEKIAIEKIASRWEPVSTGSWFYNDSRKTVTGANIQKVLHYDGTMESVDVTGDGVGEQFSRSTDSIALNSGQAVFLYLANPASINGENLGQTVKIKIQSLEAEEVVSVLVSSG